MQLNQVGRFLLLELFQKIVFFSRDLPRTFLNYTIYNFDNSRFIVGAESLFIYRTHSIRRVKFVVSNELALTSTNARILI